MRGTEIVGDSVSLGLGLWDRLLILSLSLHEPRCVGQSSGSSAAIMVDRPIGVSESANSDPDGRESLVDLGRQL